MVRNAPETNRPARCGVGDLALPFSGPFLGTQIGTQLSDTGWYGEERGGKCGPKNPNKTGRFDTRRHLLSRPKQYLQTAA
jgi:hypothetical protein